MIFQNSINRWNQVISIHSPFISQSMISSGFIYTILKYLLTLEKRFPQKIMIMFALTKRNTRLTAETKLRQSLWLSHLVIKTREHTSIQSFGLRSSHFLSKLHGKVFESWYMASLSSCTNCKQRVYTLEKKNHYNCSKKPMKYWHIKRKFMYFAHRACTEGRLTWPSRITKHQLHEKRGKANLAEFIESTTCIKRFIPLLIHGNCSKFG